MRLGQRLTTYTRSNLYLVAILAASNAAAVAGRVANGGERVRSRVPADTCGGGTKPGGSGGRPQFGGFEDDRGRRARGAEASPETSSSLSERKSLTLGSLDAVGCRRARA